MLIKTLLNKVYHFKGFVYEKVRFVDGASGALLAEVVSRKNSRPVCPKCHQKMPGYDKLQIRRYEFIPIWGIKVFLVYQKRRANCSNCGIVEEDVPWASGKNQMTNGYRYFLADWAKVLSWKEAASRFKTSWHSVYRAVRFVVSAGLASRNLDGITSIGIDEISIGKGHKYATLVYQIDNEKKRLLYMAKGRSGESLEPFFTLLGEKRSKSIRYVCTDMWKAYMGAAAEKVPHALNILDRFHIMKKFNEAVDQVRRSGMNEMKRHHGSDAVLKNSRWCLLKRRENLSGKQEIKLAELLRGNLKTIRAYLLKEDFNGLWTYVYPAWAGKFIDRWTLQAMRSQLTPMKKAAKMIRKHKPLILNWFKARNHLSSGVVEGLNNRIKVTVKKSYGFRTFNVLQIALFHDLAKLPIPSPTHIF